MDEYVVPENFVTKLVVVHNTFPLSSLNEIKFRTVWKDIEVDSGQVCITDLGHFYYRSKDYDGGEYDKYCRVTDLPQKDGIVGKYIAIKPYHSKDFSLSEAYGVCSRSGYGDGTYAVKTIVKDKKTISIMIKF